MWGGRWTVWWAIIRCIHWHLAVSCKSKPNRLGLIGVGGVSTGWYAYAKFLVGADMVQLYTGLALEGPHLPNRILYELAHMLDADGVTQLTRLRAKSLINAAIKHALGLYEGFQNNVHNSCQ